MKSTHLNTSHENFLLDTHVDELRGFGVDGGDFVGWNGAPLVDGFTDDVHNPAQGLYTDGDTDGIAGVVYLLATYQTFSTVHGDGTHGVFTQVLGDLRWKVLCHMMQVI